MLNNSFKNTVKIIFVMNATILLLVVWKRLPLQLARALNKLNCSVEVVTARNPISLPAHEIIDGVLIHRLLTMFIGLT